MKNKKDKPKQETLEEVFNIIDDENCRYSTEESDFWHHYKIGVLDGLKWQQEQIGKSEFLQKLRATMSDAEARRLIFEQFSK